MDSFLKHCVIDFSFSTSYLKLLFQLGNVKHKYDADEQAAIQHFEVSQVYKISSSRSHVVLLCSGTPF